MVRPFVNAVAAWARGSEAALGLVPVLNSCSRGLSSVTHFSPE